MSSGDIDIDILAQNLIAGEPVSGPIGLNGRLHIERPLPFLCLYRYSAQPAYKKMSDLVTTQASWLIEPSKPEEQRKTRTLLSSIIHLLSASFSDVLLVDIEVKSITPDNETPNSIAAEITLHAAADKAPTIVLQELNLALESAKWSIPIAPEIKISYDNTNNNRLVSDILKDEVIDQDCLKLQSLEKATYLSIEISPYFINSDTNKVLPLLFAELRFNLSLAIKRAVFCFTESNTTYSPQHYHELGPKTLKAVDIEVDRKLTEIDQQIDLILSVTPVNSFQAWQQFRHSNYHRAPEFHYRALRTAPWQLKRQLFSIPVEMVDDPALHQLFAKKQQELDQKISMLVDRNTDRFVLESQQVYGTPNTALVNAATSILQEIPPNKIVNHTLDQLDAEAFAHLAKCKIENYREQDKTLNSKVTIRDDIPGIMVSHGNFLIGTDAAVNRSRVKATLEHEIGTHVLTWHNGGCQPLHLLQSGLAGYEALQEGIAVLSEYLVGELDANRIRQLSGRVIAVDQMVRGNDFLTVFKLLTTAYQFHEHHAYNITMRVFRGGGFTKDAVYLKGLLDIIEHIANNKSLKTLFVGKISFEDFEIAQELLWRNILLPAKISPNYLNIPEAQQRIQRIRESKNHLALIMEEIQ